MSKQTNTAAKCGNTTSTTNRANRWRKIATEHIANLRADHALILQAMADVNELDPVEYIVRNLRRERGLDDNADLLQQENRRIDEHYETTPSRTRTAHDKEIVLSAIYGITYLHGTITAEETAALVRRHGRKDDSRPSQVIERVVRAALAA